MSGRPARERATQKLLDDWSREGLASSERGVDDQRGVRSVASALRGVQRHAARQQRRRRVATAVASAVAVLALALGGAWLSTSRGSLAEQTQGGDDPSGARLSGQARVVDAEGHALGMGEPIPVGKAIATLAGEARVEFPSGASLTTTGRTQLRLAEVNATAEAIFLGRGEVDVRVPPRGPHRTFSVATPSARVVVHGTRFRVVVGDDDSAPTRVIVQRGLVGVHVDGLEVARLSAGEAWPPPESRQPDSLEAHSAETRDATRIEPTEAPAPVASPSRGARTSTSSKRSKRAARGARRTTQSSELGAENRAFARAMARKRAGDAEGALRAFHRFISAHGKSVLLQEARVERFRLLERLGRHAEARRRAQSYLESYPSGFARAEAQALTGGQP